MTVLSDFKILQNRNIAKNVYYLELSGNTDLIKNPGQFVNVAINNNYLRRPISICDYEKDKLILIYKVLGKGTLELSQKQVGEKLNLLLPLGNGFDISKCTDKTVLVGGGVGVPPLVRLCKDLLNKGKKVQVVLGFNTQEEVFGIDLFKVLGVEPIVTTLDGSYGVKGLVTDALININIDYIYSCGPEPMLKALYEVDADGQFSFEQRMACGFGGCMGCTCKTKDGYKRICKEGPVLFKEEIVW